MHRKLLTAGAAGVFAVLTIFASSQKPDPAEAARLNNLGAAYMNQQLFEKALKAFQDAAALDPSLLIARLNQGIAQFNLAHLDAAKPLLEEAIKRAPDDPHAWYNLGLLYKNSAETRAAIEAFRRVTEIDPNDADSWYFLGASYAQEKQFPQAIDAFQHALKIDPLHASAEFGLARAYQQSGDAAQAREHLARFQHITQEKLGHPIGLAYGDQGKYSLAEESPLAPQKVPPQIPVKFVDVTKEAGLLAGRSERAHESNKGIAAFGPGACLLDYDNDGQIDIFLSDDGPQGGMALFHNNRGKFEDATLKSGLNPALHAIGCTTGDYDNDGFADLVVTTGDGVVLFHNEKNGTFKDVTKAAGIKDRAFTEGATFIDYDHDGDLDLYIARFTMAPGKVCGQRSYSGPGRPAPGPGACIDSLVGQNGAANAANTMWRNNANGTFTDVTQTTGLANELGSGGVASFGSDYNNDRAIDLVVDTGQSPDGDEAPTLFENPREGRFIPHRLWPPRIAEYSMPMGIAVLDFNHDGWMDLALAHYGSPGISLWQNKQGKDFEERPLQHPFPGQSLLPVVSWARAYGVAAIDYDNDGWVDLVAAGETADGKGEVRLFRNLGPDGWKDVTADVGLDKIPFKDPRAIITGDFDNDGATDLLITQNSGPAILLRNEGGNKNNWLRLNLKGLADNKSAIGTKVEVFSDGIRQKFEIYGSNGYLGQNSPYLTVGLGQAKQADIVRMLWPSGVLQDEINVPANTLQNFVEMDRRGSSCPTLFVWNGHSYELVGDMLGDGVIGHWVGPDQRNIPRPTEYIKIDRSAIREKNGKFSFRFMEPLEEAVYLDQVKLLAIDHPANLDVFPNEYFASNPPFPPFKVVFSRNKDAQPPAGAWDEHGHDLLPDLLAHRYVGDFGLEKFQGFAKTHTIELDLGSPYRGGPLWLLMHGEIEYFSATSMYAAYQAGLEPVSPYLEALVRNEKDSTEKWVRVADDIGFPAGGARTMTADLTGKLPEGTRRIRLTTNLQIYWDSILIDRTPQDEESKITSLPLARADLRFHGFPLKIEDKPPGNVKYIYENASATGPYTRPAGAYTRYGDVLTLLNAFDDRLVVFGSGDEVALEFDPAKLPALPKGWVRDYFFVANGYEKDMDFYAADFDTVDPIPFRAMGIYPYPAGKSYPLSDQHLNDLLNYNTRFVSGDEAPSYRFDYAPAAPVQEKSKH